MQDYRISFRAVDPDPLSADAGQRLVAALEDMPGPVRAGDGAQDDAGRGVGAAFTIVVSHGMADAARDGSRFAKEGLKAAGLPDAALVELHVRRED